MRKTALSIFMFLAGAGVASAADVSVPAAYDWSGFYGGVHAGYLWGNVDLTDVGVAVPGGSFDGFVGGPLAGFNMQHDNLVFGFEGDFGWSNADGQGTALPPTPDFAYDLNWNGHIRARAGLAADNFLFFAAGGLALADFDVTEVGGPPTGKTYTGFTIGGGVDVGFSENLIGRVEYFHDEYGKASYTIGVDPYTSDISSDTVRAALIYRF